MARRPQYVTECGACRKRVGVQREYNLHPEQKQSGEIQWRLAKHGTPTCPNSRVAVEGWQVRRNVPLEGVVTHG